MRKGLAWYAPLLPETCKLARIAFKFYYTQFKTQIQIVIFTKKYLTSSLHLFSLSAERFGLLRLEQKGWVFLYSALQSRFDRVFVTSGVGPPGLNSSESELGQSSAQPGPAQSRDGTQQLWSVLTRQLVHSEGRERVKQSKEEITSNYCKLNWRVAELQKILRWVFIVSCN